MWLRGGRVREKGFSRLIDIRHLKWIVGVNADGIFTYWQRITTEYWPGAATQPAHAWARHPGNGPGGDALKREEEVLSPDQFGARQVGQGAVRNQARRKFVILMEAQ
ncbi:hypothetical protein [Burkholderia ubonensis]|uniref:hypothetical protein n=1 Tax=Burkholderia ubonensis TaxID=101571 RepID=UPI0012FAF6A6|nr:hypothetical protein [Burkholderia ubonensis]